MLKTTESVKTVEAQGLEALLPLLRNVSAIQHVDIVHEVPSARHRVNFIIHLVVAGPRQSLICEVIASGEPRHLRLALYQLRDLATHFPDPATLIVIAPYLSHESRSLCDEFGVSYVDLEGNARLNIASVYIERQVGTTPTRAHRKLRSLFKTKSGQILRVMLRDPLRTWRVAELAAAADVSLGHVSNVRAGLLDREWAEVSGKGLFLVKPDALLDEWRDVYAPPAGDRRSFYTALHGGAIDDAVRDVLRRHLAEHLVAFASFSAAQWLAPYGRTSTHYLYADEPGCDQIQAALNLTPVIKGANVEVLVPNDLGLFRDSVMPAPDVVCTSPVQTYLDLTAAGERGGEAAEHLRRACLTWRR